MNGDFAQGTISFTADLPQEVIDKVLANTKEDMDKWLESGNTFDLSDGTDRTVAYISFPKGTKPEDVVQVVRCAECKNWLECLIRTDDDGERYSRCCLNGVAVGESFFCADGERRNDDA